MESIVEYNGFTVAVALKIVGAILLLLLSGMMSASEVAFFSLSHNDLRDIKQRKTFAAEAVLKLLSDVDMLLATILVMNNLVNICIVILTNDILGTMFTFHRFQFLFTGVLVTFLLLLFGEILPKIIAQGAYQKVALMLSQPLSVVRWLCYPFSWVLVHTSNRVNEIASRKGDDISIEELADAVDMTSASSDEEQKMLSGIVNFGNTEVEEIMRSRIDITAIELTATFEQVKQTIIESGFSRLPVYDEDLDNIKGTLYVKDLLPYIKGGNDFGWQRLMRKAYFVPMHKKIDDLLEEFRSHKVHMAIVVDEYGATQGLLSLEDILEEVVGEISDESDVDESFYTKLGEGKYLFDGKTHIVDFERVLELEEDSFAEVQGRAETLAGLMLELKRNFLKKGDKVSSHGFTFKVESMEGRRIDKIKVTFDEE
ncbi:MAG: gliding motility-associated protein GldE [Alistipes sp.]|nr:gliding motility-associated protein GldE [Alistipes sp.]